MLPGMAADTLIADKAFDGDRRVIEPLAAAGKAAVIPPKANRKISRSYDRDLYKARHLIETSSLGLSNSALSPRAMTRPPRTFSELPPVFLATPLSDRSEQRRCPG